MANETTLHNTQAETEVLSAILQDENIYTSVRDRLDDSLFYGYDTRNMYSIVRKIEKEGRIPTLSEAGIMYASEGGNTAEFYIIQTISFSSVSQKISLLQDLAKRRQLYNLCLKGITISTNPMLETEEFDKIISDLKDVGGSDTEVTSFKDSVISLQNDVAKRMQGEGSTGLMTGLHVFDVRTGWHTGDLVIIAGRTSQGKALPLDANILTPNGWVKNRDIKIGDAVCSIDGKPSFVTGVYYRGVRDVYEITFTDGRKVRCCGEHLWEIQSCKFKGSRVVNTLELQRLQNNVGTKNRMRVPDFSGIFGVEKNFIIHPYILGVLIGDGCLTRGVMWSKPDEFIVNKISSLVGDEYIVKNTGKLRYSHRINTKKGQINPLLRELERLGLRNKKSAEKFIPKEYLECSRQQRIQLLQGLMDTDGYVDTFGQCVYSTKSEQLAKDVRYLAHSLGYNASLFVKKAVLNKKDYGLCYNITINDKNEKVMFTLPRKAERMKTKKRVHNIIRNVEFIGREECQCISVSHERELYVTDGFIMTHNTSLAVSIMGNMAMEGIPSVFYSMEMGADKLTARITARYASIASSRILYEKMNEGEYKKFYDTSSDISELPIYFDERNKTSFQKICTSIRAMVRKHGIKIAFIDYLQILANSVQNANREQLIGDMARELKQLAVECDICVVALSQLARNPQNPEPTIGELRGSGQIEEAADVVVLVYRPSVYGIERWSDGMPTYGTARIEIGKGRNIGLAKEIVSFNGELTFFEDYTETKEEIQHKPVDPWKEQETNLPF